jgi:hypothetical protein
MPDSINQTLGFDASVGYGPCDSDNIAAINTAVTGYTLTTADLSAYTSY